MRVQLIRQWKYFMPGKVLDLSDGVAELLKSQGKAEEYTEPPAEPKPLKRKRGRPRKEATRGDGS